MHDNLNLDFRIRHMHSHDRINIVVSCQGGDADDYGTPDVTFT